MSQRPNHRRGEGRHQDNGPRWENQNPMAGCNSTHVARARRAWRNLKRRLFRRKVKQEKLDLTYDLDEPAVCDPLDGGSELS